MCVQETLFHIAAPMKVCIFQVRTEISQEYEHVKDITNTLSSFRTESRSAYSHNPDYEPKFGDYARHEEPTRDPDVWPPPTPIEHKFVKFLFWL